MKNAEEIKQVVRDKYAALAQPTTSSDARACCSDTGCGEEVTYFAEDYTSLTGYQPDADLGLGCGLPTEHAQMKKGDTVVDLGSGAGNDCFVARSVVGESGQVMGVDMTSAMIDKARKNAEKLGYNNVTFHLGEIEQLPLEDNLADVVVSNCVLNLVPNKARAFRETFRVIKPSGHFSISDVVLRGNLPDGLRESAELYAGCVSGALLQEDYLRAIEDAGFEDIRVQKERRITLPDEVLGKYLPAEEVKRFRRSDIGIFSVTVYAEKP